MQTFNIPELTLAQEAVTASAAKRGKEAGRKEEVMRPFVARLAALVLGIAVLAVTGSRFGSNFRELESVDRRAEFAGKIIVRC